MKNPLYLPLLAAALIGCSGGKSTDPGPEEGTGKTSVNVHPYSVSGTRIITPAIVDTSYFCFGSELETDTTIVQPDTVTFSVTGETLTLITRTETMASGAVVEWVIELTRSGSGTGLLGTWKDAVASYRAVSGELTQEEKDEIEEEISMGERYDRFYEVSTTITENTITTSANILTAELFVFEWNEVLFPGDVPDSAQYDISLKILDQFTVELKGNLSGETVRIHILPNGDRTYSSSDAANGESRYVENSRTCPNNMQPFWYVNFLDENSSENEVGAAAKTGKNDKKAHRPSHFPFFPLKPASIFLN